MRKETCCFTGHRKLSAADRERIEQTLEPTLLRLIEANVIYFRSGGALGFDTICSLTVLKLKKQYPHIKLALVLPCRSQTRGWSEEDIKVYEEIKQAADTIVYTSEEYTPGCMHKRNRHLVEHSSICVAFLKKATGGSRYTVDYAHRSGLAIINLAQ